MSTFSFASKVSLLSNPGEAAQARLEAISSAQNEIFLSTYILKDDKTSLMMLSLLKEAANRGIKVNLVVDGYGNSSAKEVLAALAKSGVHVEIYKNKWFSGYGSYDARMHDKLLVVDDRILIMGDRNLGAEYYNFIQDLSESSNKAFISRDVRVEGEIAKKVADYVSSLKSHKVTDAINFFEVPERDVGVGFTRLNKAYAEIPKRFLAKFNDWETKQYSAEIEFYFDKPNAKNQNPEATHLGILRQINTAQKSLLIENPYIVLNDDIHLALQKAVLERGVTLTVLTNSVDSTDSMIVAGGWIKSRETLAALGATIYEVRGDPLSKKQRFKKVFKRAMSKASLHSKMMVVDGDRVIVTSYNFDPRSANRNTEVALLIKDKKFADRVSGEIGSSISHHAVKVAGNGRLSGKASNCGVMLRGLAWALHRYL